LVAEAIGEISDIIDREGEISDVVISRLVRLFDVLSYDTIDVISDVFANSLPKGDIFTRAFGERIVSAGLMRLLTRIVYFGSDMTDMQREQNVEAFLESGVSMDGRNTSAIDRIIESIEEFSNNPVRGSIGVVNRILNRLKKMLKKPPDVPVRTRKVRKSKRSKRKLRKRKNLRQKLGKDITSAIRSIPLRSAGFGAGLVDTFNSLQSRASDIMTGDDEDKKEEGRLDDVQSTSTTDPVDTSTTQQHLKEDEIKFREMEDTTLSEITQASMLKVLLDADHGTTQSEILESFNAVFAKTASTARFPIGTPQAVDAIEDIHRLDPSFLRSSANRLAGQAQRIIRKRNFLRNIPNSVLIGALASAIISGIIGITTSFFGETEAGTETEPPTEGRLDDVQSTSTTDPIDARSASSGRQTDPPTEVRDGAHRPDSFEFKGGEEKRVPIANIDKPIGVGELRAQFMQMGINYFNNLYDTPIEVQNSEWSEFDFVGFDTQNQLQIDNLLNQDIRFQEPLFKPAYVPPPKPPSKQAVIMGRDKMSSQIQITQQFAPKFTGAVSVYDNLSNVMNNDAFSRSWETNVLYHPDGSIY